MTNPMQRTVLLVARAKQGDREAENELFERYGPRVLALVRAHLRGKLRRKMESVDVQQEVMLRAHRGLKDFDMRSEKAFLNLLEAIVMNELRDKARAWHARKRNIDREVEMDAPVGDGSQALDLPNKKARTPSQDLRRREDDESLRACFARLSPAHRQLITMRDHHKLPWGAIGQQFGIGPDAARQRHKTARSALERLWHPRRRSAAV